ncbi:MAG: 5'/3'-nucleotidase SurE [Acidimicrobiia bacterium]
MLRRWLLLLSLAALTGAGALGSSATAGAAPAQKTPKLRVLVTNDDGVAAAGIDVLVEALRELRRVKVTVVAPAENQSGKGDATTPGVLSATDTTTASGFRATAVAGTPADSVLYGLEDVVTKEPHLVVSGINEGQNLGPALDISGTVGAALTAAREGIPALAASQGLGDEPDYPEAAELAIDWVKEHRKRLVRGRVDPDEIANLNVPTCATGEVRGLVEVPPLTTGELLPPSDCESTLEDPPDDVVAFSNGFATLSEIPAE